MRPGDPFRRRPRIYVGGESESARGRDPSRVLCAVAMAARADARSATVEQIHAAYSLGGDFLEVVCRVVLPATLPEILTGLRIAIGFGWTTLVAAKMVAATAGLGQMVLNASSFFGTDMVVMGVLPIGMSAWELDLEMRALERRLVP